MNAWRCPHCSTDLSRNSIIIRNDVVIRAGRKDSLERKPNWEFHYSRCQQCGYDIPLPDLPPSVAELHIRISEYIDRQLKRWAMRPDRFDLP